MKINKQLTIKEELNEFLLYTTPTGEVKVEVLFHDENIWLALNKISLLFDTDKSGVSRHINNIFQSGELNRVATVAKIATVQTEGGRKVTRDLEYFNLDVIISVGYRVNSSKATQFRIWATQRLKDFVIKGFVLDDKRLKNGRYFGKDYFEELLERVRSIRASERRIYLKITDIFQECSIDYDSKSQTTRDFFSSVQNKFHYAISEQTAAEIIYTKADSKQPHMGLTTWKNSPKGRVLQSDVKIAKNYLSERKIKTLDRTVSSFFDYIENILEKRKTFTMSQFASSVNKFLEFNEYKIIEGKGSISKKKADQKAIWEYEKFNKTQIINSDFEKELKKIKNN